MLKVEGQLDIAAGDHMLTEEEARMHGMTPFEHCLLQVRRRRLLHVVQIRRTWEMRVVMSKTHSHVSRISLRMCNTSFRFFPNQPRGINGVRFPENSIENNNVASWLVSVPRESELRPSVACQKHRAVFAWGTMFWNISSPKPCERFRASSS